MNDLITDGIDFLQGENERETSLIKYFMFWNNEYSIWF